MVDRSLQLRVVAALQDKLSGPLKKTVGASKESAVALKKLQDKLKALQGTQKTVGQFRELSSGLAKTGSAMREAQSRVNELSQRMKAAGPPSAALRREFNQATAASKKLKLEHQQQSQKLQGLRDKLHTAGVSTKSLGSDERQLRERITSTNQALEQQKAKLSQVAQQQRKLGEARERYQKTTAAAANLAVTGAAGYASGKRVLGGMAGFMAEGADFDKQMSKVQALTRLDKGSAQMQMLRDQARQLGATTAFTSTDAAAGQAFLGMAGFTPESIKAAMPGVLNMALAGDMDLATTADISSNVLTGMGLNADQMERVADVMTGTFTRSNTDIQMLGDAMKYAGPMASQLGVDLETTMAMLGKLGDAGLQGEQGGTGLQRIFSRLAAPNKAANDALEKLGVTVEDSAGKLRPMTDLLAEMYEKSKRFSEIDQATLWKGIAGETGMKALSILTKSAGAGELQEFLAELYKTHGEASKNATTLIDNARGDLELLKSAWADVSIEVFTTNNAAIRELIQTITAMTSALGAWARKNPELVATIIKVTAVVAALMVGLGGIAVTVAGILGPFAMMRFAMTAVGIKGGGLVRVLGSLGRAVLPMVGRALMFVGRAALMNPIGVAIAAIAAAAYLIYKYWDPIKAFFASLWDQVKTAFDGGIAGIGALILNWSPVGLFYKAFQGVLSYLGVDLPATFTGFGAMLIRGLVDGIKSMGSAVKDAVVNVGSGAVTWFKEKLGIQSPSRVFMDLGANISEGAAIGIGQGQNGAMKAANTLAAAVMAAGAMTAPAMAAQIRMPATFMFDTRPPIAATAPGAGQAARSAPGITIQGDSITIQITATGGAPAQDIAQAVAAELDRRDQRKQARTRSLLRDYEQ